MGWRQADTQTIALYLMDPKESLFYPRIRWGGAGPGYVETELQLYPAGVGLLMRAFGPGEWAGQLVSLLAVSAAAVVLWLHLARRYGAAPATLGIAAFLSTRAVAQVATAIQPDALCLLAYTSAWACFCLYAGSNRRRYLAAFTVLGCAAMLIKPTAAQIGLSSALLLFFPATRRLLKTWEPWAGWAAMLLVLALFMMHARTLYVTYGNTFGVLSGGDSKVPHWAQLLGVTNYLRAARNAVSWGTGVVGALGLLVLASRRRLDAEHWALLLGTTALALVALRYTSGPAGAHYFVLAGVLGAAAVAAVARDLFLSPREHRLLLALLGTALGLQVAWTTFARHRDQTKDVEGREVVALGKKLGQLAQPNELVAVRSLEPAYDTVWHTPNNFQDPRAFYVSGTRGWVLASDQLAAELLEQYRRGGASFYADPVPPPGDAELEAWLAKNASLVATTIYGGRIFQFRTRS